MEKKPATDEFQGVTDPSQMKMTKQRFVTDFFLITNFLMLKLWLTLIKQIGGGILIEN